MLSSVKVQQTKSPVPDARLSVLLLRSVCRNLPMLQLCLTWQLSSEGLSIIHIHEGNVREQSTLWNNCEAFSGPVPSCSTFLTECHVSFFLADTQTIWTHQFDVKIHENNQKLTAAPTKAKSILQSSLNLTFIYWRWCFQEGGSVFLTCYVNCNLFHQLCARLQGCCLPVFCVFQRSPVTQEPAL